MLVDAVAEGKEEVSALFTTAEHLDSAVVNHDIKDVQNSSVRIAYLTSQIVSTVYSYSDAVEVRVDISRREGAVRDITDITDMTDMEIIDLMIGGFESWDEKLAFYSKDSVDIAYITGLATEAYANDCRDIVCEPTGIKTERYEAGDGVITEVYLDFSADREECERRAAEMRSAIDSAADELMISTEGLTDEDMFSVICAYVRDSAVYAQDIADTPQEEMTEDMFFDRTAYGALVSGRTVCTGYAYAFKALCDRMGLPCWVVFGKLYSGDDHAWNAVYLDGEVKYVDVTFLTMDRNDYFLFDRAMYSKDGRADYSGWVMPFE